MEKLSLFSGSDSIKFMAREMDNESYNVRILEKYKKFFKYTLGRLPIGIIPDENRLLRLNIKSTTYSPHSVMIAKTGSGKTWLEQTVMSRVIFAGGNVCVPTDTKNEYNIIDKPLQKQFHKFLIPKANRFGLSPEKPMGVKVKSYYPTYFSKDKAPEGSSFAQFRLKDLSLEELLTIAGIEKLSVPQQDLFNTAYENMEESGEDINITNLKQNIEDIVSEEAHSSTTKRALFSVLSNIEKNQSIGDQYQQPDFVEDMKNGIVPVLNLLGVVDEKQKESSAYLSVILRRIFSAKMSGELTGHVHINIDEARVFCPRTGNPPSKRVILDMLMRSRQAGISLNLIYQNLSDVPPEVAEQVRYIYIPPTPNLNMFCEIVKQFASSEFTDTYNFKNDMAKFYLPDLKVLPDGSRNWCLLDKAKEDPLTIFRPLAPLFCHVQSK